jgi:hypothetical protein
MEAATQSLTPTHQAEDKVGCRMEISTMGKYMELATSKYITLSHGLLSEFHQDHEPDKEPSRSYE